MTQLLQAQWDFPVEHALPASVGSECDPFTNCGFVYLGHLLLFLLSNLKKRIPGGGLDLA